MKFIIPGLAALVLAFTPAAADHHEGGGGESSAYAYTVTEPLAEQVLDSGFAWKILVDAANLGGEDTRIAELTFPAGYAGQAHVHGAVEIFYVLSGRFGHTVNGQEAVLAPGEIGIVRPGDDVIHFVDGDAPATVLTIWVPGGADAPFHGAAEQAAE